MAYAAEWDLDDPVIDREEVEAVVAHVGGLAHVAAEVTVSQRGLVCSFRFPVASAADVVAALDPAGQLLGEDWWRDLDPPLDGEDGYSIRVELVGPIDGAHVDDEEVLDDGDDLAEPDPGVLDDDDLDDDEPDRSGMCVARLPLESADNREAWPVAFALATAVVDRLGGDLRDDLDEELYELQRHVPAVVVRTAEGIEVVGGDASPDEEVARSDRDEDLVN